MFEVTEQDVDAIYAEFAPEYDDTTGVWHKQIEADLSTYDLLGVQFEYGSYEGSAFVLLREKATGDLYCVEGGHCSCFGFEGQWSVERTHVDVLKSKLEAARRYDYGFVRFFEAMLAKLEAENA